MPFTAAVVGLGYWGPNLARNIAASPDFELAGLCDLDSARLERAALNHPSATITSDFDDLLVRVKPALVCIATPVGSHFPLARKALAAGADVLVEKPMTLTSAEARELLAYAKQAGRRVFVDHTFLFTGAVQELSRLARDGSLGTMLYVDSVRINLGLFQPDVDVIWDLAPHDLSIIQHVIGRPPRAVRAMGNCHNPSGFADVAYLHIEYGEELTAHLHLSWLSPVKVRRMLFAGTKQFVIYDDLDQDAKIKIYDHGVAFDVKDAEARRRVLVSYRKGDMRAPNIVPTEALAVQLRHIAEVMAGKCEARASGDDGAAVVAILTAAQRSLEQGGTLVQLAEL